MLSAFAIQFLAGRAEQLTGRAAKLFNVPAQGEPLIATFPQIKPGDDLDVLFESRKLGGNNDRRLMGTFQRDFASGGCHDIDGRILTIVQV